MFTCEPSHAQQSSEWTSLLEPEFDVVAIVADGIGLLRAADASHPDLIVTDIAMPGLDGIAATRPFSGRPNPDPYL